MKSKSLLPPHNVKLGSNSGVWKVLILSTFILWIIEDQEFYLH